MAQVSAAWVMSKEGVTAPIVGTTNLKNLEDLLGTSAPTHEYAHEADMNLLGAVNVTLTEEEQKFLEEPYRPIPSVGFQ